MISSPGSTVVRHVYPHPTTGEQITGYRRKPNAILYRNNKGEIVPYVPQPNNPEYEAAFLVRIRDEGLRLIGRRERREMWKAEQKRYKEAKRG